MDLGESASALMPDLSSFGGWTFFFGIILLSSATPFPLFATEAIVAWAGTQAPWFLVGIVAGFAGAIGELTTYVIGYGSEKLIAKKKHEGSRFHKAESIFDKWGFVSVIIFAFTPLPMDLMGLVGGVLHYDIKRFFLATLIGKIPRFMIIAFAGASIGAAIENGDLSLEKILSVSAIIAFVALIGYLIYASKKKKSSV